MNESKLYNPSIFNTLFSFLSLSTYLISVFCLSESVAFVFKFSKFYSSLLSFRTLRCLSCPNRICPPFRQITWRCSQRSEGFEQTPPCSISDRSWAKMRQRRPRFRSFISQWMYTRDRVGMRVYERVYVLWGMCAYYMGYMCMWDGVYVYVR